MGMSASQARLLSITSRMNDVEFKSQQISNTKIRLADESEQVANDYTKALNKQKYTYTAFQNGQTVKVDLNSSTLANCGLRLIPRNEEPKYRIVNQSGKVVGKSFDTIKEANTYYNNPSNNLTTGNNNFGNMLQNNFINREVSQGATFMTEVFRIEAYYPSVPKTFSASDLYEMIESGQYYLEGNVTTTTADGVTSTKRGEISVSSNTNLAIESDTTELAKAEAEYNAKTAKINNKEKLLDNDLKALDTEHSALKTEYESVKSLIGENIDKSFNLFS